MDSDRALELLGDRSRWKIGLYCLVSLFRGLCAGWHMMSFVFVAMEPSSYHCQLPEGLSVNESIPEVMDDGVASPDKCNIWSNYSAATNRTTPCPNRWLYEPPIHSIANEWDLVCDKSYLVETSETFFIAALIPGALIMTALSDWFGRKRVFLGALLATSLAGLLTSFAQSYMAYIIGRLFTGIFQQGIVLVGFVYVVELFPASQRTEAGMITQNVWALSLAILAGIAWISPNWIHVLRSISLPGFLGIIMIWLIPESLPWLTAKNKIAQAKRVMETAAHVSRITLPPEFQLNKDEQIQLEEEKGKGLVGEIRECLSGWCRKKEQENESATQYSLLDVLRSRKLLIYTLINAYIWCSDSLIYYGLSLSTGSLAGNPYINFCLSGLVEIPAFIVSAYVLKTLGRRWSIFGFHIISGLPLFLTLFIPVKTVSGIDLTALIVTLSMIGKFGITGAYGSIFLYTPELFPTTVRNMGVGILAVVCRFGNIIAPFSSYVAKRVWWLPNVVFGVMAIIGAILTLFLPETLNRPLPDTIEQIEGWSRTLSKEEKLRYKAKQNTILETPANQNSDNILMEPLNTEPDSVA